LVEMNPVHITSNLESMNSGVTITTPSVDYVNGNATGIGAYTLQGSYNSQKYNGNVGYLIGSLPNPGLKWEKTSTAEVGLDLSFFDNRLNANFTYYNRLTMDKYADLSLPTTTGFSSVKNNNGDFVTVVLK
jgi:outer membrane receptor protein involved in Fe transport